MIFNSVKEIEAHIASKLASSVEQTTVIVYQIIDRFVKEYYAEYSPKQYKRTYQLYQNLVKVDAISTGLGIEAYVYFDTSMLDYKRGTKKSTDESVEIAMSYAAHGHHGRKNIGGTAIWDDPIGILNKDAINILKSKIISAGIPIH